MREPTACAGCLRRGQLMGRLAPYIDRSGMRGARIPELLRLSNDDLAHAVAPGVAEQIVESVASIGEGQLREELARSRCWACCQHDESLFPGGLRDGAGAPWALIGQGDPALLARLEPHDAVAVVGSRRASSYGREVSRQLGADLARAGMAVVSGLAFGVDACAHRGALDDGLTVAVLGTGADVPYPTNHRSLARRIAESGLILSEMPPGTGAWRWSFPARNRIIAGLAGMTVVVEAAERSGSILTADFAVDLGRDLGAVPGPVSARTSVGTNALLANGAAVVRDAQDVLDSVLGPQARGAEPAGEALSAGARLAVQVVEQGATTCDEVAAVLGLSAGDAAAALSAAEGAGYVRVSLVGAYTRTELAWPSTSASAEPGTPAEGQKGVDGS